MGGPRFLPLTSFREYPQEEMALRARNFFQEMGRRRTVREFSHRPVPKPIIEDCIRAAGSSRMVDR